MKKTHLFCTRLWFYLSEIPAIALLVISIIFNNDSGGILKLFPLIIFSAAAIIFIFLYFFRMIIISYEEIKCVGAFSSKDSAIINKDKTLIFTVNSNNKIIVKLHGDGGRPGYNWAKGENYLPKDIDLFREKAVGGLRSVKRVLEYFNVPKNDINEFLNAKNMEKEYQNYIVSRSTEEECATIKIKFKKTI